MASFDGAIDTAAPPEDVFELLYDPDQFSRWWGCMQSEGNPAPTKHPDFGPPQVVSSSRGDGRVTVSCSMSDIVFDWQLEERPQGGTTIGVHVEVPDAYRLELEGQRAVIAMSLRRWPMSPRGTPPRPRSYAGAACYGSNAAWRTRRTPRSR